MSDVSQVLAYLKGRAMFEQAPGGPHAQACPDCPAKAGEPCVLEPPGPTGPSYVHIRRCFVDSTQPPPAPSR